ncbi:conserved hypothetical protein [Xenorhabdus nematophila ATCC 19061]|uniref:Uncharacterized protein n=1 Tax=Xenorhabdus nematophila (strain ATCC 19061 / DSM 3370 / CCUG 14189 / LMG 1036 / NCIMB 9965 / AN6) TaxID=406817 RepID=D3VI02_XENNA|nr:conserved hypothetical protein [Xenorhabdus nematophila ATCC 19061]
MYHKSPETPYVYRKARMLRLEEKACQHSTGLLASFKSGIGGYQPFDAFPLKRDL